jgi:hypothetical protein
MTYTVIYTFSPEFADDPTPIDWYIDVCDETHNINLHVEVDESMKSWDHLEILDWADLSDEYLLSHSSDLPS